MKINPKNVVQFGTTITKLYYQNKKFKKFESKSFIIEKGSPKKKYLKDVGIKELRKHFDKYDTEREEYKVDKSGSIRKATAWTHTPYDDRIIKISSHAEKEKAVSAVKKGMMFGVHQVAYYRIFDNFYRPCNADEYLYFDIEKQLLVRTGEMLMNTSTKKLEKWLKGYTV